MQDWIQILLLGAIEGITEFLPISSTGHLILAEQWLHARGEVFNVVIQCGAVLAVLLAFWSRLKELLASGRQPRTQAYLLKLLLAFVVTGFGGLLLKHFGFKLREEPAPVAWATLAGGVLILVVERWLRNKPLRDEVTWGVALVAGLAQLLAAIFPGTSRSGATILFALAMGTQRPVATFFSFLLGVPTLLAAGGLEIVSALKHGGAEVQWWGVLWGSLAAMVTAFVAVRWLLRYVQSHTFVVFGWYRIILGIVLLIWLFA